MIFFPIRRLAISLPVFIIATKAIAGIPVWTFSAPNPAQANAYTNGVATVTYTVTNQSNQSKNLILKSPTKMSASPCILPSKGSTCTLTLTIKSSDVPATGLHSGPILCDRSNNNQCYQPAQENNLNIIPTAAVPVLQSSVEDIVLSVSGLSVPSGKSRTVTITNTGNSPALNLTVNQTGLPSGTVITTGSNCEGANLNPNGGSCTVVITPGPSASSDCTIGTVPTPGIITIQASAGSPTSFNARILGYGCQYQGGFLFSIDDSTAANANIGGKVAALNDQYLPTAGLPWNADPACASPTFNCTNQTDADDFYYGQNLATVQGSSNINGSGDTWLVASVLLASNSANKNNPATYAAGGCISYNGDNRTDWYLPAICDVNAGTPCSTPTQNIVQNLSFILGDPASTNPSRSCNPPQGTSCLAGFYWTSTESTTQQPPNPKNRAWFVSLSRHGSTSLGGGSKRFSDGVRCIRDLTV